MFVNEPMYCVAALAYPTNLHILTIAGCSSFFTFLFGFRPT